MTEQLRGAMVGAGFFAQFHAEAWKRIPAVNIAAIADADGERAARFADRWGIPAAYASAGEMLERAQPDFVDIVTRPDSHLPLTRLAAQNGVDIICQKPMADSLEQCLEMVKVSAEAGVRLVIHENWRWQPWYREVKRLAGEGRFGRIYHLAFRMRTGDGRGSEIYTAQPYFRDMPRFLLHETIVHFLDTFRFLAGEIETVCCTTQRVNPAIRGEDYAIVQLRFASGACGIIDANRISGPGPAPPALGEFWLEGERAAVRMSPDGSLWLRDYGQEEVAHVFEKPDSGYKGDSIKAMQEHFIACLQSGAPAESEGRLYLRTVAVVEACYRSAATGQTEKVETPNP